MNIVWDYVCWLNKIAIEGENDYEILFFFQF